MHQENQLLAKSKNYGGLSLLEHTEQVRQTISVFAEKYARGFDAELSKKGAILHDLGKAHPHFQRRMQQINADSLSEEREWNFVHRHEISSLAFLPCFPQNEWAPLIDMVVAHHKSIQNDARERGILDLWDKYRDFIDNHLKDWESWSVQVFELLKYWGINVQAFGKEQARQAIDYAVEYCDRKGCGWSPWRGLLQSADHFASAFTDKTHERLQSLFEVPDLSYFHQDGRKSALYPLSQTPADDPRPHTLVVAPTGAGKTDFLMRRCRGRVFYTLPFQASINAMWERLRRCIPNRDIRILHAASTLLVGKEGGEEERILQPLVGAAVKVLTPHQLAAVVFGTAGFESVLLDVQGCDVVLDEIHSYSNYSQAMVLEIVKTLLRTGCRLHIGTATMPSVLYQALKEILGGERCVYEVALSAEVLDSFDRHQVYKLQEETETEAVIARHLEAGDKVLIVHNTVGRAQETFKKLEMLYADIPKLLLHSRFRRGDRADLETRLKTEFNGDGSPEFGQGHSPCLVVSTQVVEVSLDISFDCMITDCAPLDGLIQRFGRVNRRRNTDTIGRYKPVYVQAPKGNSLPYDKTLLETSFGQLPDQGQVLHERNLQDKIDRVYPNLDLKAIDLHLIYKNGKYNIRELCNKHKAVLIDVLEIESACCILEEDRETYLTADWETRQQLEIPVNYKVVARHRSKYERLEVGSYPFVIPQPYEHYIRYGLEFVEHENLL